eukprot:COSAG01_NODE_55831_length_322_cov_1.053812_1_plen_20_part_01
MDGHQWRAGGELGGAVYSPE